MKKIYLLFFILACMAGKSFANEITVKGFVRFPNGSPASNISVKILIESPCVVEHVVTTNKDGFYTDKIRCEDRIAHVRASIVCGGQTISFLKEPSPNFVVEVNFTLCNPDLACAAKFTATQLVQIESEKFPVRFNGNISEINAGDKIIDRTWKFGDGEIIEHGTIDPTHNYAKPGVYEVCLKIKTDKGCTSTKCVNVEVKARCRADFRFEMTSVANQVKFNSTASIGTVNDPIVNRSWNFGDGTPIIKGNIDPMHIFPRPGIYNVCLVVWTAGGCETKECKQVVVPERATKCHARFSFERIAPKKFRFNSNLSEVAVGDEIVERQWEFKDGIPIVTTHDASMLHEFEKPGVYEVCLKIKTAKGCESRFCVALKVGEGDQEPQGSIKIISLYPIPVYNELKVLVFSRMDHIPALLSVIDIYGQVKWTKSVWLVKGNNPFEIATGALLPGPYFIRVTTSFGVQTRPFHKI